MCSAEEKEEVEVPEKSSGEEEKEKEEATMKKRPLRIGVLGAARIVPIALIYPAKLLKDSIQVYSIAARDANRGICFSQADYYQYLELTLPAS